MADKKIQEQNFTRRQEIFVAARGHEIAARICAEDKADVAGILDADAALALARFRGKQASESDYTAICAAFFAKTYPASKPSERNPHIMGWIADRYLNDTHNGKQILLEDIYKIGQYVQYFTGLKNSGALPAHENLLNYASLQDLDGRLAPFMAMRALKAQERLERHMPAEIRAQIMAATTVLYSGKAGDIVMPHTVLASQYWGNATRWCLSGVKEGDFHFSSYNLKSPIIMLLPRDGKKMALVNRCYYNAEDKSSINPSSDVATLLHHAFTHMPIPLCAFIRNAQPYVQPERNTRIIKNKNDIMCKKMKPPLSKEELKWAKAIAQGSLFAGITRLPPEVRMSERIFLEAVSRNGMALEYASHEFKKGQK